MGKILPDGEQDKLLRACSIYIQNEKDVSTKASGGSSSNEKSPYTLDTLHQNLHQSSANCESEENIQQKEQSSPKTVKEGEEKEKEEEQEEEQEEDEDEEINVFQDQMDEDIEESDDLEEEEEGDDDDDNDDDRMEMGGFSFTQGSSIFENTRIISETKEALKGSAWQVSSGKWPLNPLLFSSEIDSLHS
ncbi:ribosomal biogenesis protein LAS1L-like [Psammomys obesus]|uniref:ribosomal biogenesis protein LAS1L-like n=1 Tax=Psammomys obesus TaxID=48139 RepID=UPI002452B1F5|nr:ribosomal biogenesis protein LAS1L-like [Psammomys obesus]